MTKKCSRCLMVLAVECFYRYRRKNNILYSRCKKCHIDESYASRKKKPAKPLTASQRKRNTALEKMRRDKDRERYRGYYKSYYYSHIEQALENSRARMRARYDKDKEHVKALKDIQRRAHPEWALRSKQRRRARKSGVAADLTARQWELIKKVYNDRCVYCERKMKHLTQDHIVPLSKGGAHTASNIVPVCQSCNSKKHIGLPLKPVQPILPLAI